MSEAYSDFAACYDQLMDNIPYDKWFAYLHSLLKEYGIHEGLVAELGCGTGNITIPLSRAGYDMIGIDNSCSMLQIAKEKSEKETGILYLCQDMREFELYGTVTAIVSICDSINYVTESDELLDVFRLVNNYLDPGGIFIFDFHPLHYYRDVVADSTIAEDRDSISFIWDNLFDEKSSINELALSLFIKEPKQDDLYRKYREYHYQRGYTLEEITTLLEQAGLIVENVYDAFSHDEPTGDSERIYVIAREHGK